MQEDRRYSGAMVDWPEVKAVDGALEALRALRGHYRMVVVTNAQNSGADQVRAALKRVELDGYFSHVFTFRELNAHKPELRFFVGVERALGVSPRQMVLVGDDFWADVSGACQAGWRAVWYTRTGSACPGLAPFHQAELIRMADLPAALESLDLPDPRTCHVWCLEQGMTFGLWQHVQLVAAIAYLLAAWLQARGQAVDPILAHRGGLLHDLAKISTQKIATAAGHGEVAASLLRERGLPQLAEIAHRHGILTLETANTPHTWEEKLVYFADRLAEGGRLVTPEERIEQICGRYPGLADRIRSMSGPIARLQAEIAGAAGVPVNELVDRIRTTVMEGND